jgi:hypothetical protein
MDSQIADWQKSKLNDIPTRLFNAQSINKLSTLTTGNLIAVLKQSCAEFVVIIMPELVKS